MLIPIKQIIQEGYSYEDVLQTIEEGAIGKYWSSKAEISELKSQNAKLNWKENGLQYLINPFVDGPIKQLTNKIESLFYQALMKIFFTGEKISSISDFEKKVKEMGSTPFSRQMQILVDEMKRMPEINKKIKDEHFIQWLINPLVPGPNEYFKMKKELQNKK